MVKSVPTFVVGTKTRKIQVALLNDSLRESDETFQVRLSAPINGTLGNATGSGKIVMTRRPSDRCAE